jgi:hypothetical protein
MMDDPQKAAEVVRLAEEHIKQSDEQRHGLHRDGHFIRRGVVESMMYYRVAGEGGRSLVHCEVTIGTMFDKFAIKVMSDDGIAPFKVGGRVEIDIRSVGDGDG